MASERNLVLMVCTGNVCRSPMAAALLRHALDAETGPVRELEVESAGVAAARGDAASANSLAALRRVGLDISDHHSQPLSPEMVGRSFAIFGMTSGHLDVIRLNFANLPERMHLLRDFLDAKEGNEIPDPFGQNYDAYAACLDAMAEAVPSVVAYLKHELEAGASGG